MPTAVSATATVLAEQDGAVAEGPGPDLRQVWAQITDPRDRRERRHSLVVILALVQAAVVAGATSFAAIRQRIGAAPQQVLADIGARQRRWTGEYQAPHPDTVCRVLQRVDPAEVDAAYARYRAAQLPGLCDAQAATGARAGDGELVPVSADGKSQRGTVEGDQTARHRLGAMLANDGITLARVDVDGKSNEITAFVPLLDRLPDLTNMVISTDMMHTSVSMPATCIVAAPTSCCPWAGTSRPCSTSSTPWPGRRSRSGE